MATSVTWSILLQLLLLGIAWFRALGGDRLDEGTTLGPGGSLRSFGCKLTVDREECQVVFYVDGFPAWSSNATVTYGATDCGLTMQDDGDLVLNSKSMGRIWHSNTGFGPITNSFYALEVSGRMLLAKIVRLDDDCETELQELWTTSQARV